MQIADLVVYERNVGVRILNVKTEHCKTRVNITEFQFILFSYSQCISTSSLDFADTVNSNFQLFPLVSFIKYLAHTQAEKLNIRQYWIISYTFYTNKVYKIDN